MEIVESKIKQDTILNILPPNLFKLIKVKVAGPGMPDIGAILSRIC
jgi:hypothetical protein